MQDLESLSASALADIEASPDLAALDAVRVGVLGKKGSLTALLKSLGSLEPEARRAAGQAINGARDAITTALESRREQLEREALAKSLSSGAVDVTLPGRGEAQGGLHPVAHTQMRIEEIFRRAGFEVAEGPEVEDDFHNFEALNFPADHPARAMHDTFVFADGRLLRTHTSPVQIRAMIQQKPPLRLIMPGRVYR